MKSILMLMIAFAAISGSYAGRGPNHGDEARGRRFPIFGCVQEKIKNNKTLLTVFISALNDANLQEFVINGTSVNFTALAQNFFRALPSLSSFFSDHITPNNAQLGAVVDATINFINNLPNNQTNLNQLIAYLYLGGYINYVSGPTGTQTVDFNGAQADVGASKILLVFVRKNVEARARFFGPGQINNFFGPS